MPRASERREGLAVNLFDVTERIQDDELRQRLLKGKLDTRRESLIEAKSRDKLRETGAVFTCDLLTAALTCDLIRNNDRKAGDYPTRVYVRYATVWERVTAAVVLTEVVGGKVILNPEVFPPQKKFVPLAPVLGRIE